jgi:2-polyprenyl-6-methoxyphenol hydroxylase-like FAD-dependent oxidoreductase
MPKVGDHAVVLGAGMSGLLAARALSDFYHTVTIVERDALTDTAATRRGVPQGRHIHALLMRGAQAMEELFPGILEDLVGGGAPWADGRDLSRLYFSINGHLGVRTGSVEGLINYAPSRSFLECHVRRRVRAIPNVTLLDNFDVVDFSSNRGHDRITGAQVVNRHNQTESEIAADLVVDASGGGARTPALLEVLGYPRPPEDHVVVHVSYASQLLRMERDALHEMAFIVGPVPGRCTGMGLGRNENDTWIFTVFGMAGNDPPPVDLSGMCAFVEQFAPARAVAAVRAAEPIGEPSQYRFPSSRWRRYDKAKRWPQGLLVVGDAVCSFNPIFAQGMTVAALEALALRDCLSRGAKDLPSRFFRATTKPIGQAWQMAAGADLSLPEIGGTPPLSTRLLNGYVDRVLTAAEYDTAAFAQFVKVAWLVDSPARLLTPAMMVRAASANRRRHKRRNG